MTTTWDTTALTAPISVSEVSRFRKSMTAKGLNEQPRKFPVVVLILYSALPIGLSIGMSLGVVGELTSLSGDTDWWTVSLSILLVILFIAFAVFLLLAAKHELFDKNNWKQWIRLERFASANGFRYEKNVAHPGFSGTIFEQGHTRQISEHIFAPRTHSPDIGNFRYVTGSGRGQASHDWGYVAVRLARRLPHIVLDATANNTLRSNLPRKYSRDQRLSLEGDFDRHFTLYCPADYESDALYVITPDLMSLLIDDANTFDVEIVDDWMFLYSSRPLKLVDAAMHTRLARIVSNIGGKLRDSSALYADPRTAPEPSLMVDVHGKPLQTRLSFNEVAPEGERLNAKPQIARIISIGILAVAGVGSIALLVIYG